MRSIIVPITILILALTLAAPAGAQEAAPIQDNSFLIEEAYNQEAGVVQHVGTALRMDDGDALELGFTQEWPLFSQRHQLSYTLPFIHTDDDDGLGDVSVDYRYQALTGRVAVAPRVSVLLPTGSESLGGGRSGVELGLPISLELGPAFAAHTNAGVSYLPKKSMDAGDAEAVTGFSLGQSVVWLAHPQLNLLVEAVWSRDESDDFAEESAYLSPGLRGAVNLGSVQIVPGVAMPIGLGASSGERALLLYLSVEHPF